MPASPSNTRRPPEFSRRARLTGLTLIDLLLGMALGLFLCATAGALLLSQLREHKHLLAETLLQQDLRNAMAVIQHEIRRAGAEVAAHELVPSPGAGPRLPRTAVAVGVLQAGLPASGATTGDGLLLNFDRAAGASATQQVDRGFRLSQGQLQYLLEHTWQPWSNSQTVRFTALTVRLARQRIKGLCPCKSTTACPAALQQLSIDLALTGQSRLDPQTVRSLSSTVRVRNDHPELAATSC